MFCQYCKKQISEGLLCDNCSDFEKLNRPKTNSVIQDWLGEYCSWKEQSVLFSALRGCDGSEKNDGSKNLIHNFRALILKDADPSSTFMEERPIDMKVFCNNTDHYPVHWLLHFMHGAEIIGYRHPDHIIAMKWQHIYYDIVHAFHMQPETKEVMTERLKDKPGELK